MCVHKIVQNFKSAIQQQYELWFCPNQVDSTLWDNDWHMGWPMKFKVCPVPPHDPSWIRPWSVEK